MLKLKLGKLAISYGDPCVRQECSYYTHYLLKGPPDMPHAAFHKEEKRCLIYQDRLMKQIQDRVALDPVLEHIVKSLEEEVRA